jgi:phosphatidate cytidylyltransferase
MLRKRIITALVLAAVVVSAVAFLSVPWLAFFFAAVAMIAAWEWSNLAGFQSYLGRGLYVCLHAVLVFATYLHCKLGGEPVLENIQALLGVACLWWAIALLWVKTYPASGSLWGTRTMLSLMGVLVLVPAWLAVVFMRSYPGGGLLLLFMVIVVAGADIGAYFSGKRWGRRKLAVAVSPGKSWEGFWGGVAACAALAVLVYVAVPSQLGIVATLAVVLSSSLASVLGDLLESMVKRHRGVKDSGKILPGHGGLLDRIDGHTAAAPVFALGLILAGWTGL